MITSEEVPQKARSPTSVTSSRPVTLLSWLHWANAYGGMALV